MVRCRRVVAADLHARARRSTIDGRDRPGASGPRFNRSLTIASILHTVQPVMVSHAGCAASTLVMVAVIGGQPPVAHPLITQRVSEPHVHNAITG